MCSSGKISGLFNDFCKSCLMEVSLIAWLSLVQIVDYGGIPVLPFNGFLQVSLQGGHFLQEVISSVLEVLGGEEGVGTFKLRGFDLHMVDEVFQGVSKRGGHGLDL